MMCMNGWGALVEPSGICPNENTGAVAACFTWEQNCSQIVGSRPQNLLLILRLHALQRLRGLGRVSTFRLDDMFPYCMANTTYQTI